MVVSPPVSTKANGLGDENKLERFFKTKISTSTRQKESKNIALLVREYENVNEIARLQKLD